MPNLNVDQTESLPVREQQHCRTAGEMAVERCERDAVDQLGKRKLNVGTGGGITCAFLRQTFAGGLPPGFRIAEVGVWHGDTSLRLAELLPDDGCLDIFDYGPIVQAVQQRLAVAGHTNVLAFGCSTKARDSYNWSLMKLLVDNPLPIYDYIWLDGSHTWDIDGFAFCLLDRLLKPGGHMDFDDNGWTMATSPTLNPTDSPYILDWFTKEQIDLSHVMLIVELLVKRDRRYQEVIRNKIFRKISL